MEGNKFSQLLFEKVFILFLFWRVTLRVPNSRSVCFSVNIWNISFHSLLACMVSEKKMNGNLWSSIDNVVSFLWLLSNFFFLIFFLPSAYGVLFPQPETELWPQEWKRQALTAGPQGIPFFFIFIFLSFNMIYPGSSCCCLYCVWWSLSFLDLCFFVSY